MSRIVSLIVGLVGISLLMTPLPTFAQEGIPDLLGTWTITETYADGDTVTRDWEVYVHDPVEGLFFARIGEYDEEISLMTGKVAGDDISMSIDNRDGSDHWDLLTTTAPITPDAVVTGAAERHYGVTSGDFHIEPGTFEMRRTDDGTSAPVASSDPSPLAADLTPVSADPQDLRGLWTWATTNDAGKVFPVYEFIATLHDPRTGVVAANLLDDEGRLVTTMAGLIDGERLTTRMTFVANEGGWSDFEGTRAPGPDLRYEGTYEISTTGETGTFEAAYVGPVKGPGSGEQAGVETDPVPSEPPADGLATGETGDPGHVDAVEPPLTTVAACDATRFDAALAALSGPTPYTATTVLQSYDGKSDESSFTLLSEEHVADPVTWERTTNVPGEAGWTVFESRRLGDEVWMRLDGGDWSVEPPEAGVLGTPWALNLLDAELRPGGQAADPVFFWNQVGEQCVVSQLFRTEDGSLGKGKGRVSRLTFVAGEALPRTIEWDLAYPPTGRIKGKATRPGTTESVLITIVGGAVEPIEAPVAE